jgi:predicted CxxxxCH...CXXCH cytochrome family protein
MRSRIPAIFLVIAVLGAGGCTAREAEGGGGGITPVTGAHTPHVTGTLAVGIACSQCHDGQFQVTLQGSLATANGAVPSFDGAALTCSNVYCHAGGPRLPIGGGTVPLPKWNPPSVVGCGACHAAPGGAVDTTAWHPAVAAGVECALCHPGFTNTTVNRDLHVNGVANLNAPDLATNCAACHGDSTRVLPPGAPAILKAAPPVTRSGGTSPDLRGVGAHQGHLLSGSASISTSVTCAECHVVPANLVHVGPASDTPATVTFGPIASANGASPVVAPTALGSASLTCSNVYCHGGGPSLPLGGGTLTSPTWNPPSVVTCGSCHALPGGTVDTSSWHPAIAPGSDCGLCHTGYTRTTVNAAVHVNGQADVRAPNLSTNCTACHGTAGRTGNVAGTDPGLPAAPPVDRFGESATTRRGVGAHQAHLNPTTAGIASPVTCAQCHVVPTTLLHVGPTFVTPATLTWGPLATANGVTPAFDTAAATCTNYCHGATTTGGSNTQPTWTKVDGTQAACGTCHGNPPTSGSHVQHASLQWYGISCGVCHPTGYAYGSVGAAAVPVHVNAVVNMNPVGFSDWNPNAAGPGGLKGTAIGCHGGTRYWTGGSIGSCQ